ncbi:hypothetical protein GCM10007362_39350 [Saccharibacillus endophyticus]|uniref:Uncharacterized protein n=1 Tax=Saccharibacillus endophyticus TaxID=2060666 RepID=A0ABQ2A5G4_9BACL|nr:hypothetical protein GCM10007362_39350 [Saccharibacillus endophyticus]
MANGLNRQAKKTENAFLVWQLWKKKSFMQKNPSLRTEARVLDNLDGTKAIQILLYNSICRSLADGKIQRGTPLSSENFLI